MRLRFRAARFAAAILFVTAAVGAAGCDETPSSKADGAALVPVASTVAGTVAWPDDDPAAVPAANTDGGARADVAAGRELFLATCSACHGAAGQGMPRQGPDLRASPLLARSTDEQVVAFLVSGRPAEDPQNTSKLPMPPRGGNAALTDNHLAEIVKFLRSLQSGASSLQATGSSVGASGARSDVQGVGELGR